MVLPVITLDKRETRDPPTLQVKLCCQREAERCTSASLVFSINRHTALLDAMNVNWTVVNPEPQGEFLAHWENMLEPEPTEPPLNAPEIRDHSSRSII
ncbi:hypothetical protein J1605_017482 [Eschrichtius robustus]|uniref:Uncharacterized protein n=1 Tax=Eschrichtius robustus TaxID=9764 RepID=A0AB34I3U5_ESCRO|nr:hypothetical protein J1605_017482 [Eschrichtius robustus]